MAEILFVLLWIALAYVAFGTLYVLFFSVVSLFYKDRPVKVTRGVAKIAVLIPGYKEDGIIYHVAKDALNQHYPIEQYDVVVIADSFDQNTLQQLRSLPIKLIEVSFEKSTKAKSLNAAMDQLGDNYDVAVVLDADNMMKPDFLGHINLAYQHGHLAIQGHRTAKNLNTPFARLDALSEEINNSIFRRGHWALGLPSALIGSAMAFDYKLYKEVMAEIDVVSGFDKELEIQLLRRDIKVAFINGAIVLDEKVQSARVFEKQRTRWMAAQLNFAIKYFPQSLVQLITKGRVSLFDKALQFILLPRALSLTVLTGITLLAFLIGHSPLATIGASLMGLFLLSVLLATPKEFYNRSILESLTSLPVALWNTVKSVIKIKEAKHTFLHTPHSHVESQNPSL